ncbi:MAG: arsenical resistance protein ArsH [Gammaproteobacteria bacterium]|nr:arsenical resistance protein ArsH [Gammaproteobacteria bacterium]
MKNSQDPEAILSQIPNIDPNRIRPIDPKDYVSGSHERHPPRILLLYGSLRERSFSRLVSEESAYILRYLGAQTRTFDPNNLPLPDSVQTSHPKVRELRELAQWAEGMVWVSPERHGAMTGVFKSQIDWIPLSDGAVRPTQGKTLAVMQVNGGSQSFNVVNQLRILGRWMRMITIPNQSSIAKTFSQFGDDNRMKASPYYNRIVDVMEELVKFTYMTRGQSEGLVDRYSEREESGEALIARVNSTPG